MNITEIRKFESLELLARQLVEGFITGLHKSPYHGFSVEFAEHKLYNFGESTRHIDWKLFSRTDRLYTKQYEEETNLRAHLVIDTSPSMYYPVPENDKIRFSIYAASALAYLLVKQRDAVGVTAFSGGIDVQTEQKSTRIHLNNLLNILTPWLEQPPTKSETSDIASVLHRVADKIHKRSLVVIFTDMFQSGNDLEELFTALQHLKHRKHEVILFHVNDHKTEKAFDFKDRPYQFVDLETNESVKINPALIKASYQEAMADFFEKVKLRCGQLKVDLVETNTADTFDKVLGAYLIKRQKMV